MTIYTSNTTQNPRNCSYPNKCVINNADDLSKATEYDYVCAQYKDNIRKKDNFICSDCLAMDCDNDHSDNPEDWVTPDDVEKAFPGVVFYVHFSRNHNKEKDGKSARPRFHVLFPIDECKNADEYLAMKKNTHEIILFLTKTLLM